MAVRSTRKWSSASVASNIAKRAAGAETAVTKIKESFVSRVFHLDDEGILGDCWISLCKVWSFI